MSFTTCATQLATSPSSSSDQLPSAQGAPPVVSQMVFLAPLDAMRKIKAEGTTGTLTAVPYSAMLASCTIWVTYGLLAGDPTIWIPNVVPPLLFYWHPAVIF